MSRVRFVRLFSVLALAFWASTLSASTITYAVGTCRPHLHSFHTISAAVAATPPANIVEVCPGTYKEQVQITQPVTLEGVSNGTSVQAIIASPVAGLVANATDDLGHPVAAQLWVNNASGAVNITNLTVDASGNQVPRGTWVAGIFYQNSSGTVNQVATRHQVTNEPFGLGVGVGIWAEGGSSNPLVTIENSSVDDYDYIGIEVQTNSTTQIDVTAMIKGNAVSSSRPFGTGIDIAHGAATVTSNLIVNSGLQGIIAGGLAGSISANTVINGGSGAGISAGPMSVTSNKIFGSTTGIFSGGTSAAIQNNTITNSSVGIEFVCIVSPNVHSNIITATGTALNNVPSAVTSNNTYFNVKTIRSDPNGC